MQSLEDNTSDYYVARGAKEAGIDVGVVLALDATVLIAREIRKHVDP